jgi:hypothetical protein
MVFLAVILKALHITNPFLAKHVYMENNTNEASNQLPYNILKVLTAILVTVYQVTSLKVPNQG